MTTQFNEFAVYFTKLQAPGCDTGISCGQVDSVGQVQAQLCHDNGNKEGGTLKFRGRKWEICNWINSSKHMLIFCMPGTIAGCARHISHFF